MRTLLCVALALGACGGDERAPWPTESPLGPVPAEAQRDGDPDAGYHALVNAGYVGCGVPYSAYSQVFAPAPEDQQLPGRDGVNAEMPYSMTALTPPAASRWCRPTACSATPRACAASSSSASATTPPTTRSTSAITRSCPARW